MTINPNCPYCGGEAVGQGRRKKTNLYYRRCKLCKRFFDMPSNFIPDSPSEVIHKLWEKRTTEERSSLGKRIASTRLAIQPREARIRAGKKARAAMSPERRKEIGKIGATALHSLPLEQRQARIAKAITTRKSRGLSLEGLESLRQNGLKNIDRMNSWDRSANARNQWAKIPPEERSRRAREREARKKANRNVEIRASSDMPIYVFRSLAVSVSLAVNRLRQRMDRLQRLWRR